MRPKDGKPSRETALGRRKRELSDFVPERQVMVARQFIAWETQKKTGIVPDGRCDSIGQERLFILGGD